MRYSTKLAGRPSSVLPLSRACAVFLLVLGVAPADAAPPPQGKTYFTILLGFDEPYSWEADCLRFTAREFCGGGGPCGTWTWIEPAGQETAIALEMEFEEGGVPVRMEGRARIEGRGSKSSLAGAALMEVGGQRINFGLTGRQASRGKCARLVRQWDIETTPPQPPQDGNCLDRAAFGPPEDSLYVLPFSIGETYHLSQTYCYLYSTHRNEFAYDFDMPVGAEIVAARAGEVLEVREDLPNDSPWPDANFLKIRHDDGTIGVYIHLAQNSVSVAVGESVERGQPVAEAAMSGTIDPHLHFVVFETDPAIEGRDVSVNFRNVDGPLDALGGLIQDQDYSALPE